MSRVAFLHTSPPAVAPLMQFYGANAPEFEIYNLLDDGILKLLSAGKQETVYERLSEMLAAALRVYGVEGAMVTCSSVSRATVERLAGSVSVPVLKIDAPMADRAVEAGTRIGVAMTFPPTQKPTEALLRDAAERKGRDVELIPCLAEPAYDALLSGNATRHDELLIDAVDRLATAKPDCIVLAQVSMARLFPELSNRYGVPVFSSLPTSLDALRSAFRTATLQPR